MATSLNWNSFRWLIATLAMMAPLVALADGPRFGQPAPPLRGLKLLQPRRLSGENKVLDWETLRGKVVVIDFWETLCGPCVATIPHWNELVSTFSNRPVQFLAISDENEEVVAGFLKRKPIDSWVAVDGVGISTSDAYDIEGIPTIVIVNQQGIVVAVTHPASLEAKNIEEIIATGKSSLPVVATTREANSEEAPKERGPARNSLFEISVRRSGVRLANVGSDYWPRADQTNGDFRGEYATAESALLTLFDVKEPLMDCRTGLPREEYDFVVRLPGVNRGERY